MLTKKMNMALLVGFLWVACLTVLSCMPAHAVGRYNLAFWREVGYYENADPFGNHSIFVWVWDEQGNPMQGVKLYTTWNVLLATTDADGRAEVVIDANNSAYDMKCVDIAGSESDVAPTMTSHRWPNYGHYSYELGFMFKADKTNPGSYDTSMNGTVNLADGNETDIPFTKSLAYYSNNAANWQSDQFALSSWVDSHGQSFVATGDRITAVQFHGAIGNNYFLSWTAEILEGGPNGPRIAGPRSIPYRQPILWVLPFGVNEAPVQPGHTYYLKITHPGGLNTYTTGNNYAQGNYFLNGVSQPAKDLQGFVLCMTYGSTQFGTVKGTVTGSSNPLEGATVTLNPGNLTQETQPDGSYQFSNVAPGSYTVSAWRPGFSSSAAIPVTVSANNISTVDISLTALTNLLINGGFETGAANAAVPSPWIPFGSGLNIYNNMGWAIPSHSGAKYAGAVTSYGVMNGGAYQTVAVTPGTQYLASGYVFNDSWDGEGRAREFPGNVKGRIGIDPAGGTNPSAFSVVWSPWNESFNRWGVSSIAATASSTAVTVFLQYTMTQSEQWNKAAFDDIFLTSNAVSPSISITSGPSVSGISSSQATISWTTNVASSSVVEYGTTVAYGQSGSSPGDTTSHSVTLTGLQANAPYHFRVRSEKTGYTSALSADSTFQTAAGPVVHITSGPTVASITTNSATVNWTTDVPSTSQVNYGLTASYGQSRTVGGLVTSHSVPVTGLQSGLTYHFQVVSGASGYTDATSSDTTFTTDLPVGVVQNPGFEAQDAYWTRYGQFDDAGDNGIQTTGWYQGFNPHGGVNYAGSAASYGTKNGGFYQRVRAQAGVFYKAAVWSKTLNIGGSAADTNNRIGIDPTGGTNPSSTSVVWSNRSSPATWTQIAAAAVASGDWVTIFLDAQQLFAVQWNINAFDDVTLTALPGGGVAQVKALADGTEAGLVSGVVSGSWFGTYYVQNTDRSSGIRVNASGAGPAVGTLVQVWGTLSTTSGERTLMEGGRASTGSTTAPVPLGIALTRLGGQDWQYVVSNGAGQRGVDGGIGLNNTGLLVRVWGTVVGQESGYLLLSDGSPQPVRIDTSRLSSPPAQGAFTGFVGLSSVELINGQYVPVVRPRSAADQAP
ncbi:MAG: carboxypeptidase regulatory-like domain-containing protein [Armatimonadetes bacterium]|nr:carboxypeptidase regulatory-like domain-containing protein [Armatimonadota bacterium]